MSRNTSRFAIAIAALTVAATAATAQPLSSKASGTKRVTISDKVGKNQFSWSSDAPLEKIKGTAEGVTGNLTIDPKNPTSLRGTISAQVATMKSGNATRDEHIRAATWLDAAKYPSITFTAKSVSDAKVSGNKVTAKVTGDFTMHGVTKQMTVPVTIQYIDESVETRKRAPGDLVMVSADFDVALKDFNVAGSKGTIGSKVGESISIKAQLFGSTGL